ncbi:MAG: hypothetical protein RIS44_2934 [Pseudomonadota bacterium]
MKNDLHHGRASGARDFRLDINGLRAWAVLAVVLFHFDIPGFSGGFVGVDMFFVISGFLMTGIVVRGLESGSFSLLSFYMARVKRIVPALVFLCAVLLALGWWLLTPTDYKLLGSHAFASVTFLSNIKYQMESGYFDISSHEKWLLHTWSLSAEWQFYLLLPLALMAGWKFKANRLSATWVLAACCTTSFVLCVVLTVVQPTAAFFQLPSRAWEMAAGGLTYLALPHLNLTGKQCKALEAMGLCILLLCILFFNPLVAWPGGWAILPVAATVMVLLASRQSSMWTAHPFAQWVGSRSYSIYLWHWPVVVALLYTNSLSDPIVTGAAMVSTLWLGHLSYRYIEQPDLRPMLSGLRLHKAHVALVGCLVVAALGLGVRMKQGVPGRLDPEIDRMSMEALNKNPRRDECNNIKGVESASCLYGGSERRAIVLGDSHADAIVSAVAEALPRPGQDGVMQWTYSGCPIIEGSKLISQPENRCGEFVDWAIKSLASVPSNIPIIIANRHAGIALGENENPQRSGKPMVYFTRPYASPEDAFIREYSDRLVETTCRLAKAHPVYLLRPIPEMVINVPNSARAMVWNQYQPVSISIEAHRQRNAFVWAAQDKARERCGVKILDPLPYLCQDGRCPGAMDGRPLYYDDDHLSESGNKRLTPLFKTVFTPDTSPPVLISDSAASTGNNRP